MKHARRLRLRPVLFALTLVLALGTTSVAEAGIITSWRSVQPKGTVGTNVPVTISGSGLSNGFPLSASSAKLLIDGVVVPRPSYAASILPTSVYYYYNPQPALADGPHTFRVEVADTNGQLSAYQWTATVAQAPKASWVAPAAGTALSQGSPAIELALTDNTPGTTFTVAGEVRSGSATGPVVAAFGGIVSGNAVFTLPVELAPGMYYLTATVTDGAGNTARLQGSAARQFECVALPAMTILEECTGCHPGHKAAHPTPASIDCMACHPGYDGDHMQGTEYCEDCHTDGWHAGGAGAQVAVSSPCTSCHGTSRPDVARHTSATTGPAHASSCDGCHDESLLARHAFTPAGSAYPAQCDLCHASANARVRDAIAAGDASCSACHDAQPGHGFDPAQHEAGVALNTMPAGTVASPASGQELTYYTKDYAYSALTCTTCHSMQLTDEHPNGCVTCHTSPRDSFATWNKTCTQGGCHDVKSDAQHPASMSVAHSASESKALVKGDPRTVSCGYRNAQGGYACHYTDLVIEHTRRIVTRATGTPKPSTPIVTGGPLTCAGCHQSAKFQALGGHWDGTCTACHPDSHAVMDSPRYTAVHDSHQSVTFTGLPASEWNTYDVHGPARNVTEDRGSGPRLYSHGCGVTVCHTQANLWPGYPYGPQGFGGDPVDCMSQCHSGNIPPQSGY